MILNDTTIRLDYYLPHRGSMIIDLEAVCNSAGKKIDNPNPPYNGKIVDYPIPRAKKLIKFIRENGEKQDIIFVLEYLRDHKNKIMTKEEAERQLVLEGGIS